MITLFMREIFVLLEYDPKHDRFTYYTSGCTVTASASSFEYDTIVFGREVVTVEVPPESIER